MSESHITRRESADPFEPLTDWEAIDRLSEAEIERRAQSDPDNPPWTDEELAGARLVIPPESSNAIDDRGSGDGHSSDHSPRRATKNS